MPALDNRATETTMHEFLARLGEWEDGKLGDGSSEGVQLEGSGSRPETGIPRAPSPPVAIGQQSSFGKIVVGVFASWWSAEGDGAQPHASKRSFFSRSPKQLPR